MQKDISELLSKKELVEKVRLFEQFMLWGWKDSAYCVARDIIGLDSSGASIPKKYENNYKRMQQHADEYLSSMVNSGYARLS